MEDGIGINSNLSSLLFHFILIALNYFSYASLKAESPHPISAETFQQISFFSAYYTSCTETHHLKIVIKILDFSL